MSDFAVRIAFAVLAAAPFGAPATAAPWTMQHFSTGTSFNHTVAVGDLNGDGRLDVAIPNSQLSTVSVLLGNGDGTLAPFTAWSTFSEPQDVVMADLSGDGIPDLATPDYTGNDVTVLRGLGDGTFAPRVSYPAGSGLISLAAVDLDGDGRRDLAVSKESGSKIAVLPALAGGTFGAAVETATGAVPHQIASADFDHDGRPDLAVVSHGANAVSIHLGNGTFTPGAATPFAAGSAPVGLTVADLDLDGDADLVVSNVNSSAISVLLGNGDGTFATPVAYPTDPRPRGMDAGDLDGDGIPDLAIATGYPDGDSVLTLYRGAGDGTLAILAHLELPYRAADLVIADMNADGWPDIVCTGPQSGVATVALNPAGRVGVEPPATTGAALELAVHPNPVRRSATLRFRTTGVAPAKLAIYDTGGRCVADLGPRVASSGWQIATWNGESLSGVRARPGVYFARLTEGRRVIGHRIVLLAE